MGSRGLGSRAKRTFLFYDIETSGLHPAFDQVLQFAAIRTDTGLQELARYEISVHLRPDVVPSPMAYMSHRRSIYSDAHALNEHEAMQRIHELANEPGTVSIGYNSLTFDDAFLRFGFYRNLLPPYTHQYAQGCFRLDLYPVTLLYWIQQSPVLEWPTRTGRSSFKLEDLGESNSLFNGHAHDAEADVEATIALAERLRHDDELWQASWSHFDKLQERRRIEQLADLPGLPGYRAGFVVNGQFGAERSFLRPVLSLGPSIPYSNQTLWLPLDEPELPQTEPEQAWVIRKKPNDEHLLLPAQKERLDKERRELVEQNVAWLRTHSDWLVTAGQYHRAWCYPERPDVDVDAALYQLPFLAAADEEVCRAFHQAPLSERPGLLERLSSAERRQLGRRLLWRNYGMKAPFASEIADYERQVRGAPDTVAPIDLRGRSRYLPAGAMDEIRTLEQASWLDPEQRQILDDLRHYLQRHFLSQ